MKRALLAPPVFGFSTNGLLLFRPTPQLLEILRVFKVARKEYLNTTLIQETHTFFSHRTNHLFNLDFWINKPLLSECLLNCSKVIGITNLLKRLKVRLKPLTIRFLAGILNWGIFFMMSHRRCHLFGISFVN